VLLMACANVATLLLVRADARQRELAIRAALGARWTRVARALLVESLTLALAGGALGVAFAYGGLRLLVAIGPSDLPRLSEISIDTIALGYAVLVSTLSGLLFGLIPILRYAEPFDFAQGRPQLALIGSGGRGGVTPGRQRSQHALVAVQMALALVLLVSSGLMIRSFQALRRVDPGFAQPERVQTLSVSIPPSEVAEPERVTLVQHEMLERIAAIPGVASAAFTSRLPMDTSGRTSSRLFAEGVAEDGGSRPSRQIRMISPDMFRTLGTPLIAGGEFTWRDLHDQRDVAILSESLAREIWGSAAASLGTRIREGNGVWREVVGVTGDVYDEGVHQPPTPTLFLPARLHANLFGLPSFLSRRVTFVIRGERTGTESLLDQVREALWSVNANLPLAEVRTLGEVYDQSMARTSFTLVMLVTAGAMALLLGVSGLAGVIAYGVSQRRREIGIRMALGAQAAQILGLFVRRGLVVAGIGVAIGLGAAAGSTRLMQSLLFGVNPLDPITFAAVPIVLAIAAALSSYLPARRALAVDPVETLRAE
jgi:putative ABC transport system permease protein